MSINNIVSRLDLDVTLQVGAISPNSLGVRVDDLGGLTFDANGLTIYLNPDIPGGLISSSDDGLALDPEFLFGTFAVFIDSDAWKAMYATPISIIASGGSNTLISIDRYEIISDYGTTQYSGGGNVLLQYGNTAHGAGVAATQLIANTTFNAMTANAIFRADGSIANGSVPQINTAVYLTNDGGAFADGDSTFDLTVWYKIYNP